MVNEIKFYSRANKYFEFSNFSLHPIIIDGLRYETNEHYFQSVKFLPTEMIELFGGRKISYQEHVRMSNTPAEAKRKGANRSFKIYDDWDKRRIDVMKTAIRAKFTQHEDLKEMLLSTGNAILIEDSPRDTFWGIGKWGNGKNMLGKLLMELREELRVVD